MIFWLVRKIARLAVPDTRGKAVMLMDIL